MADAPNGKAESIKQRVAVVMNAIRPMLQADGGDIELVDVTGDGVVQVRLRGACAGCPGAQMTLKMGVEKNLKEKVPEVSEVVCV